MSDASPEKKLLDIIKEAQSKFRMNSELKIFTKINIFLMAVIVIILAVFLVDVFTVDYKIPELDSDLAPIESEKQPLAGQDEARRYKMSIPDNIKEERAAADRDAADSLTLLGIIKGEKDQAVIESKSTKKTYFLYKGEGFEDFVLSDIKDGTVILDYKGEKIQLNM